MDWKERMDEMREITQTNIKSTKKQIKQTKPRSDLRNRLDSQLIYLEAEVERYNSRKVHPVRLDNGSVINMKTVNDFLKKLKRGTSHEVKISDEDVQIVYKTSHGKGRLTLIDMRERYVGWSLPKVSL